ncbi:28419_t:CDS:2, partial [Dentiscutata erythropus]
FDKIPAIGMGVAITSQTTQTTKTVNENIVLDFYVKEKVGEKEPNDFWVEVRHKHVLKLEEISLLSIHISNKNTNNQAINIPWLSQGSSSACTLHRINCTSRGATPRTLRKDCPTLSQMGPTIIPSFSFSLQAALKANPVPLLAKQTTSSQETQDQNDLTDPESN